MTTTWTARRAARVLDGRARRGDEGFTLVAAIAVTFVAMLMAVTVVAVTVRSEASAGHDRARTQAIAAAEAGVDSALVALRSLEPGTQSTFACAPPPLQVWSSPGTSSVAVTHTFHTASGTVACPLVDDTGYRRVVITSTATHTFGGQATRRSMSAVVELNPRPGASGGASAAEFSSAFFSDASPAPGTLRPAHRIDGDVRTNGDFACRGSTAVTGTVTAVGRFTTAEIPACFGTTYRDQRSRPAPTRVDMPAITYPTAGWPGTTVIPLSGLSGASGCTLTGNVAVTGAAASSPVIVDARSCDPLRVTGATSIRLLSDLTVFAGSFTTDPSASDDTPTRVRSGDGGAHAFRIIVPATRTTGVCDPPEAGELRITAKLVVEPPLTALFYTRGRLTLDGALGGSDATVSEVSMRGLLYGCTSLLGGVLAVRSDTGAAPPASLVYAPSSPAKVDTGAG